MIIRQLLLIISLTTLFIGCSTSNDSTLEEFNQNQVQGEYIYRQHDEHFYAVTSPKRKPSRIYPWEQRNSHQLPRITKEYFRCKGCSLNPELSISENDEVKKYADCDGIDCHGLPLQDGKEFIYPILINLLNHIQHTTGHRLIITSGHRCPTHNSYVNPSKENLYSKHMIGAETSFYVETMENDPLQIIDIIRKYYLETDKKQNAPNYTIFRRYDNNKSNVRTDPWYNKEIFIKLFEKDEGRDLDNRHPYPYISLQVRFDRDSNETVSYTWNKAHRQHLRR